MVTPQYGAPCLIHCNNIAGYAVSDGVILLEIAAYKLHCSNTYTHVVFPARNLHNNTAATIQRLEIFL